MNAGDADVVDGIDLIAHDFGGDLRFLGDEEIAGAGAHHRDDSFAVRLAVAPDADGAGGREAFGFGMLGLNALGGFAGRSGNQDVGGFRKQAGGDGGDLVGSFALPEDHFRHAVA